MTLALFFLIFLAALSYATPMAEPLEGMSFPEPSPLEARSTLNGACTGNGGASGVCVSTSSCSSAGGTYVSNKCPGLPENIKCCTKTSCSSGGSCEWTGDCDGSTVSNLCPGPSDFKCCLPNSGSSKNLGEKILAKAKTQEGLPYVWGGGSCSGPTGGGFDCSGLVSYAVCQVTGRNLFSEGLRVTRSMYCASEKKLGYKKVAYSKRRKGDAVFFGGSCDCSDGASNSGVHHVGIMMNSGTKMWNALKTGTNIRADDFGSWSEKPCPYVIRFS
ncbi:hypothetical protein MKZ38_000955 [Zalerion maritima]|uniref:NlpC/P60 domain-containing protein n=1 Tax=Zalerion maritima TaxID=339359 RepID=A0AAD5RQU3_9PEZI|nr:hypothetical protein MKZ38_000955 [Zalerion maritima]